MAKKAVSAEVEAALRSLYEVAVEANASGLAPEAAMAYRHACGLAWHRLDLGELAVEAAAGRLPFEALVAKMAPFVREALAYVASSASAPTALH